MPVIEPATTDKPTIKCLSMTQPWASLVAWEFKRFETRGKDTRYRGPLAIQSATSFPKEVQRLFYQDPFRSALIQMGYSHPVDLPLGRVLSIQLNFLLVITLRVAGPGSYCIRAGWISRCRSGAIPGCGTGNTRPGCSRLLMR